MGVPLSLTRTTDLVPSCTSLYALQPRAGINAGRPTTNNFRWQISPWMSVSWCREPQKAFLCVHSSLSTRLMDNQALDTQLYRLLAQVLLPLTASLRFDGTKGECCCVLNEFGASLAISDFSVQIREGNLTDDGLPFTAVGGRSS